MLQDGLSSAKYFYSIILPEYYSLVSSPNTGMLETEPEIIRKAASGNRMAFRQLVEMHQRFVYAVAVRILNNPQDSEDATQETFIRLWKNLKNYNAEIKLTTWLYRIVTNICLDVLKSATYKRNRMTIDLEKQVENIRTSGGDQVLQQAELIKVVEEAAAQLPHLQKIVFVLRDLQGLSPLEVSEILETSEDKIKSNLYHARLTVGSYLKQHYQIQNIIDL
jgi:RNA polymerase sigma-70 factor (ECF subfamily)